MEKSAENSKRPLWPAKNWQKLAIIFSALPVIFFISISSHAEMGKGMSLPMNWRSFTHVKSMVIPDKNHSLYGFHHIYVNNTGLKTLIKGGEYPQRTIFVGAFYDVVIEKDGSINQGKKLFYVLMIKDARAAETGGWIYAAFDEKGKYIEKDVQKECFECHVAAKDSDYIFSKFIR